MATQTSTATRNTYYHLHPRNFANECNLVRCETALERESAVAEGYERLTRAELARHISHVNGENDAWGSNRAFGRIRLLDVVRDTEYRYGFSY